MKYLLILLLTFIGCTTVSEDDENDSGLTITVNQAIKDQLIMRGTESLTLNLKGLFLVNSAIDTSLVLSIDSLNQSFITSHNIQDGLLNLTFNIDSIGTTAVRVLGTLNNETINTRFKVIVQLNQDETAFYEAKDDLTSGDYTTAVTKFLQVINSNETDMKSKAHLGYAYANFKLDQFNTSLTSIESNINTYIGTADYQDMKSLLVFLNYSYKQDYKKSKKLGLEVLLNDPTFVFEFDTRINYKDIRLNVALSQFALQEFVSCYESIQMLDSEFTTDVNSSNFIYNLDLKLQSLITEIYNE